MNTNPNMNPIKEYRKRRHQTLQEFANDCGVHLQAVFLNEQGVYIGVLPSIAECMVKGGASEEDIQEAYRRFVQEKREIFGGALDLPKLNLGPPTATHPVVQFRGQYGLSRMALAKGLCIHPASLHKLERGDAIHLPEQFVDALLTAGVPSATVEELNFRCQEWAEGAWTQTVRVAS